MRYYSHVESKKWFRLKFLVIFGFALRFASEVEGDKGACAERRRRETAPRGALRAFTMLGAEDISGSESRGS